MTTSAPRFKLRLPAGFTSLVARLRLSLAALGFLSVLAAGSLFVYLSLQNHMQAVRTLQYERSRQAALQIDAYMDDLQLPLNSLARVRGLADFSVPEQQALLEGLARQNDAYDYLAIANAAGETVVAVAPDEAVSSVSVADTPLFARAFRQHEDYVGPVERQAVTGLPTTTLAVPIRDANDAVAGVLWARINLSFLWFVLSQNPIGDSGYLYILDERQRLIAESGTQAQTFVIQDLRDRPFLEQLMALDRGGALYRGLREQPVFGSHARLRSTAWLLVSELPTAEAFAPIRQLTIVMVAVLLSVTLAAGGLGLLLSLPIVRPLRRLTAAATRISDGDFAVEVQVRDRNELGLLADTFNQMTRKVSQLFEEIDSERNFVAAVLETAGALVLVVNRHGEIIRFNHACEQTTGYARQEVLHQPFWHCLAAPERDATAAHWLTLAAAHFPRRYESIWRHRDGDERLIAWSDTVLVDEQGEIEYVVCTGIDVTERRAAERARRETEERLKAILNNSPEVVYLKDPDGCYLLVNRQFEHLFQVQEAEFVGKTDFDLFSPTLAQVLHDNDLRVIEQGITTQVEEVLEVNGQARTYIASKFLLYNDGGDVYALCSIATEITDRKQAELELARAKEAAEMALNNFQRAQSQLVQAEKMSSLGQLVSGVAHEINNPVNFIYGNLVHAEAYAHHLLELVDLYQQRYGEPEGEILDFVEDIDLEFLSHDFPKILHSMKIGATRIRNIVLSLRNFSRLDEADLKEADLHEGIDNTLLILNNRLKERHDRPAIAVHKQYGDIPKLECYAGQLNQVFMNLLVNAIDAIDEAGPRPQGLPHSITITTHCPDAETVAVHIADTAGGMTPETKQKLFTPFFTTKPVGQGTGLGLSISYQIITDKHGGQIFCESEVGHGTEFILQLPRRRSASPS